MVILTVCCATKDKRYLSKAPHIRWDDIPTGLSQKLDINGCFYGDNVDDPIHFDNYGFAISNNGYIPGAYILNGDTITVDWYDREGIFYCIWSRRTIRYIILSRDSIMALDEFRIFSVSERTLDFKFKPTINYIYKRFDCPEDLKIRDEFLRKQKWMWESEEARKQWEKNSKNK